MRVFFVPLILLKCFVSLGFCWPAQAPTTACASLVPEHFTGPQPADANPYELVVMGSGRVEPGRPVKLELRKKDEKTTDFKGFIVQARDKANGKVVGDFSNFG